MSEAIMRLLEVLPSGERIIHADSASQDYSLCGYAYEGACDDDDHEMTPIYRGKINCRTCVAIILYAKTIPARLISQKAPNHV